MPLFHRSSSESDKSVVHDIEEIPFLKRRKSFWRSSTAPDTGSTRPHTSADEAPKQGIGRSKSAWSQKRPRRSIAMSRPPPGLHPTSLRTTERPLPALPQLVKASTCVSRDGSISAVTVGLDDLAIGSPPDVRTGPEKRNRAPPAARPTITAQPHPHPNHASIAPQPQPERPKLMRWRTVSGIFSKRKTQQCLPSPLVSVSEEGPPAPLEVEIESVNGGKDAQPGYFHFKRKDSVRPTKRNASSTARSPLPTPTPGDARAIEAGEHRSAGLLNIDIPQAELERYSVVFSDIVDPRPAPAPPAMTLLSSSPAIPPEPSSVSAEGPEGSAPIKGPAPQHDRQHRVPPYPSLAVADEEPHLLAAQLPAPPTTPITFASPPTTPSPARSTSMLSHIPIGSDLNDEPDNGLRSDFELEAWALGMLSTDPRYSHCFDSYNHSSSPSPRISISLVSLATITPTNGNGNESQTPTLPSTPSQGSGPRRTPNLESSSTPHPAPSQHVAEPTEPTRGRRSSSAPPLFREPTDRTRTDTYCVDQETQALSLIHRHSCLIMPTPIDTTTTTTTTTTAATQYIATTLPSPSRLSHGTYTPTSPTSQKLGYDTPLQTPLVAVAFAQHLTAVEFGLGCGKGRHGVSVV